MAVMSADGSALSAPIPVRSTFPYVESDSGTVATQANTGSSPVPVEIDNVFGDLVWSPVSGNGPSGANGQQIFLEGKGLAAGLTVNFQTDQGTYPSTTAPTNRAPADPSNQIFQVPVPNPVTDHPTFNWLLQVQRNSQPPIFSSPKKHQPQPLFSSIFGGRVHIIPYFDPLSKQIVFKQEGFLRPGDAFTSPLLLPLQTVTWSFPFNPVFADGIPAVQREMAIPRTEKDLYRGCDLQKTVQIPVSQQEKINNATDLYLRTTHLSGTNLQVQAQSVVSTASGPVLASGTFQVRTYTGTLGTSFDKVINTAADEFGVPPQFLLAQAVCESNILNKYQNFRYEPITIDMRRLSGEGDLTFYNGARRIYGRNLGQYAIGGMILDHPVQDQLVYTTPPADTNIPTTLGPQFILPGSPVRNSAGALVFGPPAPTMAYSGIPGRGNPRVSVMITDPPIVVGNTMQPGAPHPVTVVYNYPVWTKSGHHFKPDGRTPSATYFGIGTSAGSLSAYQASFDFVSGPPYTNRITLGQRLLPGQTLTVTYYSVDGGNLSAVGPGSFTYNLNAGIANGDVLPQFSGLKYDLSSAQSLYDWFKTNLQSSDVNYQYGNWLTGTDGERLIPFIGVSDPNQPPDPTKPRQIRPVAPVDGRFTGMTAQFFAGSSYGPVHMTAFNLDDPTHGPDLMNVLKGNPIFIVFKDHANPAITLQHTQIGFELGATFTGANYSSQCPKPIGSAAPCGTEQWEDGWSDAFEPYNHGGEHYKDTPSDIIKLGRSYEPH